MVALSYGGPEPISLVIITGRSKRRSMPSHPTGSSISATDDLRHELLSVTYVHIHSVSLNSQCLSTLARYSISLFGWGKAGCVHLCHVTGNTVWSHMASDIPWLWDQVSLTRSALVNIQHIFLCWRILDTCNPTCFHWRRRKPRKLCYRKDDRAMHPIYECLSCLFTESN